MRAVSWRDQSAAPRSALFLIALLPTTSIPFYVSPYVTSGLVSTADGAEDG